jgi:hypothetical protein
VDALAKGNSTIDSNFRKNQASGEGYGEYVAHLVGAVAEFAAQPGQQRALDVLVHSPYNADSEFAEWLGERGDAVVPSVMDLWHSDLDGYRETAVGVFGRLLRPDRKGAPVSPANRNALRAALLSAARDKNASLRWQAVQSLGLVADREDIPLLEQIASSDPAVLSGGRAWVREAANKVLQKLR